MVHGRAIAFEAEQYVSRPGCSLGGAGSSWSPTLQGAVAQGGDVAYPLCFQPSLLHKVSQYGFVLMLLSGEQQ